MEKEPSFRSEDEYFKTHLALKRKIYCINRAFKHSREELMDHNYQNDEGLVEVIGNFTGYDLQLRILDNDCLRLEFEFDDWERKRRGINPENSRSTRDHILEALDIQRDWRMELEASLQNAQQGNWAKLKHWMGDYHNKTEDMAVNLHLKAILDFVTDKIPDTFIQLKVPAPAWMDERFQADHEEFP